MADELYHQCGVALEVGEAGYLRLLGLRRGDIDALRRQGFVSGEVWQGRTYFKLRFRSQGRQAVVGLGSDPRFAEGIRSEVTELQKARQFEKTQTKLVRAARSLLRRSKCELKTLLEEVGYGFHGLEIRRRRESAKKQECQNPAWMANEHRE